jgi:XTP/dITP diphosphohydrolase
MSKTITYVTGNWAKIASAKKVLNPLGFEIDNIKMETPEIQEDDVSEVAKYSAKWAAEKINKPVLKNDSGLYIESLKGFPGTYTHYVDDTLGADGILKLMEGIENRQCYFKEALAYCEPGKEPIVFEGFTKGKISLSQQGDYGWTYDKIFIPEGEEKTMGCFPDDERWDFWDLDAYKKLAEYVEKNT